MSKNKTFAELKKELLIGKINKEKFKKDARKFLGMNESEFKLFFESIRGQTWTTNDELIYFQNGNIK